jgi:hypothetical protein
MMDYDFDELHTCRHENRRLVDERDALRAEIKRLRRALSIIEDRHHPDSEWCDEAKEVLGG